MSILSDNSNILVTKMMWQGRPHTLKEMMFGSKRFKILFFGSITGIFLVILFILLSTLIRCSHYHSCSYYYDFYQNQCHQYGTYYCCTQKYVECGDRQCLFKPSYHTSCLGLYIALWVILGLTICLILGVFITFCNLRSRTRNPLFNPGQNYVQINPELMGNNRPILVNPAPESINR